jgi:hypothetical protein
MGDVGSGWPGAPPRLCCSGAQFLAVGLLAKVEREVKKEARKGGR